MSLPHETRVAYLISRMTTDEKIAMLGNRGKGIAALGVPSYNWWSEASTGVANWIERRGQSTQTTKFAFPITTAMSFNRSLWTLTGRQIGREGRAMMNAGTAYSSFWAPVINLAREPRWGRNIETPGEDPYLTGEYAVAFTQGMQNSPEDAEHLQASACCKHYIGNTMESTREKDGEAENRGTVDSNITMRDLVDSYMVPFQQCVEKGKVSGLMCSYNSVNGAPSCANKWLLDTVARGEWGFQGYITSDCSAEEGVLTGHHYMNHSAEQVVADILHAGTDVGCQEFGRSFVVQHAATALGNGTITLADIEARLAMQLRVRLRLGHFDQLSPLSFIRESDTICTDYAIALSMEGAIQGAVLLKNLGGRSLPLALPGVGTVAVIGPLVNYSEATAGYYGPHHSCGHPHSKYWTLVDAVAKYSRGSVTSTLGVPTAASNDSSAIPAAAAAARLADTVVMGVGSDLAWAAEGHDALSISLTDAQSELIRAVAEAATRPIIVVVLTATPLDISAVLANPKVGAVLHVGQPSVTMLGIAELIYGKRSPAGRTCQTFYKGSYQDQISIFDFNMRPGPSLFARPDCTIPDNGTGCPRGTNPGRTHRFYVDTPVVPFGFGLSYSSFSYKVASAPTGPVSLRPVADMLTTTRQAGRTFPSSSLIGAAAPLISYAINVTNTGRIDADDAVLGFAVPPGAGVDGVPLQSLFGFERVHVKAGETVTVWLYPSLLEFTTVNSEGVRQLSPGGEFMFKFGVRETSALGQGYVEHTVRVV